MCHRLVTAGGGGVGKRKWELQLGTKLTLTDCVTFYKGFPSLGLGLFISK